VSKTLYKVCQNGLKDLKALQPLPRAPLLKARGDRDMEGGWIILVLVSRKQRLLSAFFVDFCWSIGKK
jgi:hypothetical protein